VRRTCDPSGYIERNRWECMSQDCERNVNGSGQEQTADGVFKQAAEVEGVAATDDG
jgi:hypothetical protein